MFRTCSLVAKRLVILGLLSASLTLPAVAETNSQEFLRAHMVQGLKYLEDHEYEASYQQFYELMQLGNGQAAAQLGLMTLNEQGTEYDPVQAWGYFTLASNLGYAEGKDLANQVYTQLSESQQLATSAVLDQLERSILITERSSLHYGSFPQGRANAVAVERRTPRYPRRSSERGTIGFVEMRILIDTDGSVAAVHPHFYTHPDFRREAERAVQRWRYEPMNKPRVNLVRLDFAMGREEERSIQPYVKVIEESLWQGANAGNPSMQTAQGLFLQRILPLRNQQIDHQQMAEHPPALEDITNARNSDQVPVNWSSFYWLSLAASAGDRTAQRALAHRHQQWREYLIAAGDKDEMAWQAAEWLTHDDASQQRGLQLYQHLQGSDDVSESTAQLLKALSPHYETL